MTAQAIQWKESQPDVVVHDLQALLATTNWINAIAFVTNALAGVNVYITKSCEAAILDHVTSGRYELGGLLLGRVFTAAFPTRGKYPFVTLIEKAVPSHEFKNSSVSLRMGPEVWTRAGRFLQANMLVNGWYHSHPNLGAFFSGTDRATQAAFFNNNYAIGLVVDPIRGERKCFFGGSSQELEAASFRVV